MNPIKALIASLLLVAAATIAACGPSNGGGSTTAPGLSTPEPGGTQPAEMTPASTSGLST